MWALLKMALPGGKLFVPALVAFAIATAGTVLFVKGKNYCEAKVTEARLKAEVEYREKADRLTSEHNQVVLNLRVQVADLTREVSDYVPDLAVCDYTRGAVRVLNNGRTGLPEAAGLTDAEAATPSTITQRAATAQWIRDAIQCREQRDQLIKLQEWYQ